MLEPRHVQKIDSLAEPRTVLVSFHREIVRPRPESPLHWKLAIAVKISNRRQIAAVFDLPVQ